MRVWVLSQADHNGRGRGRSAPGAAWCSHKPTTPHRAYPASRGPTCTSCGRSAPGTRRPPATRGRAGAATCGRYFRGGPERGYGALALLEHVREAAPSHGGAGERLEGLYSRAAGGGSMREAAEHACWAIHNTCRSYGIPIPDTRDKVGGHVPRTAGGGCPTCSPCRTRHMGVPGAATEGSDSYYFNLNLRRLAAGVRLTEAEFAEMKAQAWEMYRHVFVEGSADSRARAGRVGGLRGVRGAGGAADAAPGGGHHTGGLAGAGRPPT